MSTPRLSALFSVLGYFIGKKATTYHRSNLQLTLASATTVTAVTLIICVIPKHGFSDELVGDTLWLDELEQPNWVNISNMKQDSSDVSASVTVFTREDIERRRYRDLFDVLRYVPGMTVARKSAPISTIDHASNTKYLGRGLEIEVNGVAQTMAAHSTAVIEFLPPIEAIDRIEVVRGSNASADGGNKSFKGTIKITTRSPEYNDRSSVSVQSDTLKRHSIYAYYNNQHDKHHLSLSAHANQDPGFHDYSPENTTNPPQKATRDDDASTQHYMLQYVTSPTPSNQIRLEASYMHGDFQTPGRTFAFNSTPIAGTVNQNITPDAADATIDYGWISAHFSQRFSNDDELHLRLSHQDWRWRQDWPVCGPKGMLSDEAKRFAQRHTDQFDDLLTGNFGAVRLSPELIALGLKLSEPGQSDIVCGHWPTSLDLKLSSARAQYTNTLIPSVKWALGVEADQNSISGDTWDRNDYDTARAYTHLQWTYNKVVVNAGVSDQHYSGRDALSSRLGVNYHFDDNKTARIAIAKGKKIPDAADLEPGLGQLYLRTPVAVNDTTEHLLYDGNSLDKNTDPQVVYNQEIGFAWRPTRRQNMDLRLFKDRYSNASFYDIFLLQTPPTGNTEKTGAEFQYNANSGLYHYGLSAHVHHSESSNLSEDYISQGGAAYFTAYLAEHYDLSFTLFSKRYKVDDVKWTQERYNRDSVIFETQLGRTFSANFYGAVFYRFDNSHYLSNLYIPDIYTVDYEEEHSIGAKLMFSL